MKKRILSLVLVTLLVLSSFSFVFGADTTVEEKTITLIHTNDTHGRILAEDGGFGFAKIATIVKEMKAENPNVLLLDAGDILHGTPNITINQGENAVKILNAVGYDYIVPGNHDFNYGTDRLLELEKMAQFKIVNANLLDKEGKNIFTPYEIKEIDGVKVAIFGLTTPETATKTNPLNVEGIDFPDILEVTNNMVEELKTKADVIVALSHVGLDESSEITSEQIAKAVEGIDVIIDGHSHTVLPEGMLVNDTLIAQAGQYDQYLGVVTLKVKDGKVETKTAKLLAADDYAETTEDADVKAVVDGIVKENEPLFAKVVAKVDIELDGKRENVRTKETNLGNLSADAVKKASGADIAFVNGGNIRETLVPGDVTKGMVMKLFPYNNIIQNIKLTGEDVVKALEVSVGGYPATQGGFLQVSGLTFTFDASKEPGSRVVDVKVAGEAIDLEKEYVVAINDFLSQGGDGYDMFKTDIVTEFVTYEEIFTDYLNTNGTKGCDVSGRIKVIEEPKAEESYTVVSGDTLWRIGLKYNTTWQKLAEYNKLNNPDLIFPGQIIRIPVEVVKPAA